MPLPEGMVKLQEMPVGLDWQLVKAGQTPGPGQYYVDDTLDSIRGGRMAKGKAKTSKSTRNALPNAPSGA